MNSINKNNEKHPIDELFRQKLSGFEIEPSFEAKEKFLASINSEESSKKPIWYFSAAAALILVGGLSWFFLNNTLSTDTSSSLAENSKKMQKEELQKNTDHMVIPKEQMPKEDAISSQEANTTSPEVHKKTPVSKKVNKKNKAIPEKTIAPKPLKSITGVFETDELIQDRLTLALQASEEKRAEQEQKTEESNDLFQKSVGETIIIVTTELDTEEIYLPELNSDSPITLAEAEDIGSSMQEDENSFMAKVFTELKHLKHGERANFNTLTAANDQSIINNEDGFIGHETMQFKQRFRWLKGKISKQ